MASTAPTSPTAKRTGPCPSSTRSSPSSRPRRFRLLAEKRAAGPSKARASQDDGRRREEDRREEELHGICHQEDGHREKDGRQEDHGQEDRREEDRRVESRRSRRDGGLAASHAAIAYTVGKGVDMTGLFISFEGVDGVGKTTQVERLRDYLEACRPRGRGDA